MGREREREREGEREGKVATQTSKVLDNRQRFDHTSTLVHDSLGVLLKLTHGTEPLASTWQKGGRERERGREKALFLPKQ